MPIPATVPVARFAGTYVHRECGRGPVVFGLAPWDGCWEGGGCRTSQAFLTLTFTDVDVSLLRSVGWPGRSV